ncbi:hypothetical protein B0H14DRAFT_2571007 [Mycena olivaceomarginata]|nr:hypothetical protein B0H14DRAFT_2571007 [Mycena olivaceomarginata]
MSRAWVICQRQLPRYLWIEMGFLVVTASMLLQQYKPVYRIRACGSRSDCEVSTGDIPVPGLAETPHLSMLNGTALSVFKVHIFSVRTPVTLRHGAVALAVIVASLNQMAAIAQISGIPYIHSMILVAVAVVNTIHRQQLKENRRAFVQLAEDIHTMLQTICGVVGSREDFSEELKRNTEDFTTVLEKIGVLVNENRSRSSVLRLFAVANDATRIREYRRQIQMALDMFQAQIHVRNHEGIINLCQKVERMGARPPPYTTGDAHTTDPTIPEEINRIAEEEFDRLLPILGVFSVFQAPPTTPQITRVLALEETDVQEVWNPISSYLDLLDSDRRTSCLKYLEDLVCRRDGTPWIDLPKYHNLVAQWCLGQNFTYGLYAADFWVHHVCHSSPSLELRDALMHSNIPLDPISLDDLPEIISWSEQQEAGIDKKQRRDYLVFWKAKDCRCQYS